MGWEGAASWLVFLGRGLGGAPAFGESALLKCCRLRADSELGVYRRAALMDVENFLPCVWSLLKMHSHLNRHEGCLGLRGEGNYPEKWLWTRYCTYRRAAGGTPPREGKLVAPSNAVGQVSVLSRAPSPLSASSLKTSRVLGYAKRGCPALVTPFRSVPCQETSSLLPVGNPATG